jgi:hypothetical protein
MADANGRPMSYERRFYGDQSPYPHIVCYTIGDEQKWEHFTYLTDAEALVSVLRDDPKVQCIIFAETCSSFHRVLEETVY